MDALEIQERVLRAREFRHPVANGRVTATLRVPTPHEAEVAAVSFAGTRQGFVQAQRLVLEQALVGWSGVTTADLLPPGAREGVSLEELQAAVPYHAALVPVLLDAEPKWAREWWAKLLERIEARNKARDTAAKNSASASSGKGPKRRRAS